VRDLARVSVIITTYNAAEYIREAVDSVLAQDHDDFEVIVVDDCSTDNTREIVGAIDSPLLTYRCLETNHGGPSRPRNVGIEIARGEIIAMLDADDLLTPGSLRRRCEFIERHPELGLVFSNGLRFDSGAGEHASPYLDGYPHFHALDRRQVGEAEYVLEPEVAYRGLVEGDFMLPSGTIVRRAAYEAAGTYDETLRNGADLELAFRVARKFPIGFTDFVGFRQRVHGESISRRGASLALNRISVLKRQLDLDIDPESKRLIKAWIALNIYGLGYSHQTAGEMAEARAYYLKSLRWAVTGRALKGTLITLLGRRLYLALRGAGPSD